MSERGPIGIKGHPVQPLAVCDGAVWGDPANSPQRASEALDGRRPGLAAHLSAFPGGEAERDRSLSRDVDL